MSEVFSLRALGLGPADEDGVIPAGIAEAMSGADMILSRARAEAADILATAQAAHAAEMRRGHAEGLAASQHEAAVWLLSARADLEARLDRIQTELADVVMASVKRIVHSFDDRTLALETVRSALAALRSEKRVQLYVAAGAVAEVRAELPRFMADYPEIELIDVIADPALTSPDVRLESELGVVTLLLDDTLAGLGQLLRGARGAV